MIIRFELRLSGVEMAILQEFAECGDDWMKDLLTFRLELRYVE
jgi:hypothetical protein